MVAVRINNERPFILDTRFIFNARVISFNCIWCSKPAYYVNNDRFFLSKYSLKMAFQFYFLGHLQFPLNVKSFFFLISAWLRSTVASSNRCVHHVYSSANVPLNARTTICGRYNDEVMGMDANNNKPHHRKGWKKNAESGTWILNDVWVFIFIGIPYESDRFAAEFLANIGCHTKRKQFRVAIWVLLCIFCSHTMFPIVVARLLINIY